MVCVIKTNNNAIKTTMNGFNSIFKPLIIDFKQQDKRMVRDLVGCVNLCIKNMK